VFHKQMCSIIIFCAIYDESDGPLHCRFYTAEFGAATILHGRIIAIIFAVSRMLRGHCHRKIPLFLRRDRFLRSAKTVGGGYRVTRPQRYPSCVVQKTNNIFSRLSPGLQKDRNKTEKKWSWNLNLHRSKWRNL